MNDCLDLIVREGIIVTQEGVRRADMGVAGGRIVKIAATLDDPATEVVSAADLCVFPGILDAHVHFNEPGRTDWEGLDTGSAALAAGGGTCFFDMPLNSEPPVLDAARFREKRALAEKKSHVDFALWGGLVPENLDSLGGLADEGAVGLKAFMCDSGIDTFHRVDARVLREGMRRAAKLGLIVAVHAEDQALAAKYTAAQLAEGRTDARAWLDSRPVEVELEAISTALELAGETRCALHVVHVSSPEGIALVADGKKRGVDVTVETCPHYLLLNGDDVVRLGAPAKCAPVLRSEGRRQGLWRRLESGAIDTIGSDHSPAPPAMKSGADFFALWGGISGCQHAFPLLIGEALALWPAAVALPRLAALLAANVANRFRIDRTKGLLAEGRDADFTLLDLRGDHTLSNAELLYRHRQGPYAGRRSRVAVRQTFVRGRPVFSKGKIAPGTPTGKFLRPAS